MGSAFSFTSTLERGVNTRMQARGRPHGTGRNLHNVSKAVEQHVYVADKCTGCGMRPDWPGARHPCPTPRRTLMSCHVDVGDRHGRLEMMSAGNVRVTARCTRCDERGRVLTNCLVRYRAGVSPRWCRCR